MSSSGAIRVLHLVSRSQVRGAELAATELADELDRLGHRNRVVALAPAFDGTTQPHISAMSASVNLSRRDMPRWLGRLRRLLAGHPVDVVLAHGGLAAEVASLSVGRRGPLLVWQRILGFPDTVWNPLQRQVLRTVARRVDAGVALTADMAGELRRLGFRGPIWTIPNFRKPDRFLAVDRAEAAARLRAEVGVPADVPLIGYVGHLIGQKRPERLLDVQALLYARGCKAHLVVAGSGPLADDLATRAEQAGVGGSVTFLGHRADVEWVFGGVDLALLTSESEGIPGVAVEAVMSGCPMVTVPVGGVAEVIDDGVTGLVLTGDDPAEMADAVAALLADEKRRAAMSEAGRKQADGLSAAATAAVYAERLTTALAARSTGPATDRARWVTRRRSPFT
jgi:glycosyltransferase involved in cell wall biosynthesis